MNKLILFVFILSCWIQIFAQQSLRYEQNKGQWSNEILYKANFSKQCIQILNDKVNLIAKEEQSNKFCVFAIQPFMSNITEIQALDTLNGVSNYFIGNDKTKWQNNIESFSSIVYKNIWQGVDWLWQSEANMPKHSYIVQPFADVNNIKTAYIGVENLYILENKLYIQTKYQTICEDELLVFQIIEGEQKRINAKYKIEKIDSIFVISYDIENYDKNKELIIDPGLIFSTYSGSHSDNWGMTSCYDSKKHLISGGICYGMEYPTTVGAYSEDFFGNWDCVITKYDSLGQNLIFSTYIGGIYAEMPHSMIANNNDEIVVFGTTGSDNFPITENAFQSNFAGGESLTYESSLFFPNGIDIFVLTLSNNGSALKSSTFIGGTNNDGINFKEEYGTDMQILYDGNDSLYANYGDCARGEVITDNNNNVYVASTTFSQDFPVSTDAYQNYNKGGQDAVLFKLDYALSSLLYATYLGGSKNDAAYSLDLDDNNRLYFCGGTCSDDFPTTTNAYNNNFNGGSTDAFIGVLDSEGKNLLASTFFGADKYDQAFFVRLNQNNFPFIFGQTKAEGNTLIHNVNYSIPNSGQFVAKLSPLLDSLCFSTVFGTGDGMINLSPSGFAIDICNRIYCAGWGRVFKYRRFDYENLGTTNLQTTSNAYSDVTDGMDFYIMSLDKDANSLNYATFLGEYSENVLYGNDHVDGGTSRFDKFGSFYLTICASCNRSQAFPVTENAFSSTNNSNNCNMASVKFSVNDDFAVADFNYSPINCINTPINFTNTSRGDSFLWNFGDNLSMQSEEQHPSYQYSSSGLYNVSLISKLSQESCKIADTTIKQILILDNNSIELEPITICIGIATNIGIDNMYVNDNIEVSWSPGEYLLDSTVFNPVATIFTPTLFKCIIKTEDCTDTLYRYVDIKQLDSELPQSLDYCSLPYNYEIKNELNRRLICSWENTFENIITPISENTIQITDTTKKYLYVKFYADGCMGIDSILMNYTGEEIHFTFENEGCADKSNGWAKVIVNNPSGDIMYNWSMTDSNVNFVDNLQQGSYYVEVINNKGCIVRQDFEILASVNLSVNTIIKDATCDNICDGEILFNVSGGTAPYKFYLNNNEFSDSIFTNLCAGNYIFTIYDSIGCKQNTEINIKNNDSIKLNLVSTNNVCQNGCSATIISEVSGGKTPYKFSWNNDNWITNNLYDVCNGTYILTVTDSQGCYALDSTTITNIDVLYDFHAFIDKTHIYDGQPIYLSSTYLENFSYLWTPQEHLENPYNYATAGTAYQNTMFVVTIDDNKGCYKSDTVWLEVEYVPCNKPNIFIPNAFSPNGDGINDILYVSGEYINTMELIIYDRWGEKVFHSNNINDGWDGKYRNKDCAAGVYYYKLEVKCDGGKTFLTSGDITLIR